MRRTLLSLTACMLLVTTACGGDDGDTDTATQPTATTAAASGPQKLTVNVDGKADKFNGAFLSYFPNAVSARPGDTVEFKNVFTGEPHTVTMGKLVDTGLEAAKGAPPDGPPPAAFGSLPTLIGEEGRPSVHQNAAQPCFLENANPPSDQENKACAKVAQPDFNGRQTYYNSGYLPEGKNFTVKLANDTTPGTYRYYCNLHGPDMSGSIEVKPVGSAVPAPAEVEKAGKAQLDAVVAKLAPAYEAAKSGKAPAPFTGNLAGFASRDVQGASVNEFIPATISAKVNEKVSWTILGPHTISFNSPPDTSKQTPLTVGPDGTVQLVDEAFAPAGGPGQPQEPPPSGPPPTGPPPAPKVIDGGRFDGTSFKSSGIVFSFPPQLYSYSLIFTKAGTYNYLCLIHPGMGGVVTVT